jgi:hypothetical protein
MRPDRFLLRNPVWMLFPRTDMMSGEVVRTRVDAMCVPEFGHYFGQRKAQIRFADYDPGTYFIHK